MNSPLFVMLGECVDYMASYQAKNGVYGAENDGSGQIGPALTKVRSSLSVCTLLNWPSSRFFIQATNILDPHPAPTHIPRRCHLPPNWSPAAKFFARSLETCDETLMTPNSTLCLHPETRRSMHYWHLSSLLRVYIDGGWESF